MNSIIVLLLLAASVASAQSATSKAAPWAYSGHVEKGSYPLIYVRTCSKPHSYVDIYSDSEITMPVANPITPDWRGNFTVWIMEPKVEISGLLSLPFCVAKPKLSVKKKAPIQGVCHGSTVPTATCFPGPLIPISDESGGDSNDPHMTTPGDTGGVLQYGPPNHGDTIKFTEAIDCPGIGDCMGKPLPMKPCGADEVCVIGPDTPDTAVLVNPHFIAGTMLDPKEAQEKPNRLDWYNNEPCNPPHCSNAPIAIQVLDPKPQEGPKTSGDTIQLKDDPSKLCDALSPTEKVSCLMNIVAPASPDMPEQAPNFYQVAKGPICTYAYEKYCRPAIEVKYDETFKRLLFTQWDKEGKIYTISTDGYGCHALADSDPKVINADSLIIECRRTR